MEISAMDFQTAQRIAKETPGSILTRDVHGHFIVRLPTGEVLANDSSDDPESKLKALESKIDRLQRKCETLEWKNSRLQKKLDDIVPEIIRTSNKEECAELLKKVEGGKLGRYELQAIYGQRRELGFTSEQIAFIEAAIRKTDTRAADQNYWVVCSYAENALPIG